jgi:tRNA threonylcarbamoyladenosine biosynthesis protein TsaE
MESKIFFSNSPAATGAFGKKMGECLPAGSFIALIGELGCGKTLLTRGICEGLGVPLRQVNSPTFVLVNEYRGRLPVFHMDLYRLGGADDVLEIGIMDYIVRAGAGVMLVEWAEKIESLLPASRLEVRFARISARKREITLQPYGERAVRMIEELGLK